MAIKTPAFSSPPLFILLPIILSHTISMVLSIRVNYVTLADNLPPSAQVTAFLKDRTFINQIHIKGSPYRLDDEVKPDGTTKKWCGAKLDVDDIALQSNIEFACGRKGVDCGPIQSGGPCFGPDTALAHANFSMNSYFQMAGRKDIDCDFNKTGVITHEDPSYGDCKYNS